MNKPQSMIDLSNDLNDDGLNDNDLNNDCANDHSLNHRQPSGDPLDLNQTPGVQTDHGRATQRSATDRSAPDNDYNQNPRVVVKDSPIHGRGVFARQNIPAFSYIGRYEGQVTDEVGMHVLWLYDEERDDWVGVDGENEMRFLNHSEDPNAEWSDLDLFATRWISAGEEITFDYGWDDEAEDETHLLVTDHEVDDLSVDSATTHEKDIT